VSIKKTFVDTRLNRQIADLTGYPIEDNQTAYGLLTAGITAVSIVGSYFSKGKKGAFKATLASSVGLYLNQGDQTVKKVLSEKTCFRKRLNRNVPPQFLKDDNMVLLEPREALLTKKPKDQSKALERSGNLIHIQNNEPQHHCLTNSNFHPVPQIKALIVNEFASKDKIEFGLEVQDLALAYQSLTDNWRLVVDREQLLVLDNSAPYQAQWEQLPFKKLGKDFSIRTLDLPLRLNKHYVYISIVEENYKDNTHYSVIYVDSLGRPLIEGEKSRYNISKKELLEKVIPRLDKPVTASFYQVTPKSHQKESILPVKNQGVLRVDGNRCGYYTLRYLTQFKRSLDQFVTLEPSQRQSFLSAIFNADKHVGKDQIGSDIGKFDKYLKGQLKAEEKKQAPSKKTEIQLSKETNIPDDLVAYRAFKAEEEASLKEEELGRDQGSDATLALLASQGFDISELV